MNIIRVTLYLFIATTFGCNSKVTPPSRPALVPSRAVWAGGVDGGSFFECDVDAKNNVNRCLVYNDQSGNVAGGGFFQLSGLTRAARSDELRFTFFDGKRISLASGMLVPVQPIRPDAIPRSSAFANGLFISCDKPESPRTDCSIYRPDGNLYFKGTFVFDGERRSGAPDELDYKFFDLSDRTIYLIGGGSLVSK